MAGSPASVPKSLAASSRQGLRRLMLLENAKRGVQHRYHGFYFDPLKKEHVCWYEPLVNESLEQQIKDVEEVMDASE